MWNHIIVSIVLALVGGIVMWEGLPEITIPRDRAFWISGLILIALAVLNLFDFS